MPGILLDTHILIWWRLDAQQLDRSQARRLQDLENRQKPIAISAITLWEIAILEARGRIESQPLAVEYETDESHDGVVVGR